MTIADLIRLVLDRVRAQHYAGRDREFMRDQRPLTKAIARYGYECDGRGWDFDEALIFREISQILDTMRDREIRTWLPIYLEAAIDRSIRLRADELKLAAMTAANQVKRVVERTQTAVVVEPTPTETLAALYRDLNKRRARHARANRPTSKQLDLC